MCLLSLILPVYNEEKNIDEVYRRSKRVLEKLGTHEIIFVNDGSVDESLTKILQIRKNDPTVKIIDFSRNFGHQIAITAGLDFASGDAVVIMDSDLQDIPELIPRLAQRWKEGYEIVYAKRRSRRDTLIKKATAFLFYRLLRFFAEIDIPMDTGDFQLLDKKVVAEVRKLREQARFMRGLISWVGFKKTAVLFDRGKRKQGKTNYSLKKMLRFAVDGITSFSDLPLKLNFYLGALFMFIAIAVSIWFWGNDSNGLSKFGGGILLVLILLLSGINFIMLGVIGEYLGKIQREVRRRPLYVLKRTIGFEKDK